MTKLVQGIPYDNEINKRYSPVYRRQLTQCTCIIPGGGCVYYRANKGDVCPFCAFPPFSRHVIMGPGHDDLYKPWTLSTEIYKEMYLHSFDDACDFEKLAIFNGGSFFPNSELPGDFQRFVYENVEANTHIRQLMVEAYPSYITETKICEAKEALTSTDFMVAIGFESQDDNVRNQSLKKRIDKTLFEKKVRMMKHLDVQVFVYAFLKAPLLTEGQALQEALDTLEYLHHLGVDEMALSCAFVPPETDLEIQYHAGEFRPPWLWSILEIIETAQKKQWPLSIGGFEDTPPPIAGPHNCPTCTPQVAEMIDHYRLHGNLDDQGQVSCACRSVWDQEILSVQPLSSINWLREKSESVPIWH